MCNIVFNAEFVCSTVIQIDIQTDSLMNYRKAYILTFQVQG